MDYEEFVRKFKEGSLYVEHRYPNGKTTYSYHFGRIVIIFNGHAVLYDLITIEELYSRTSKEDWIIRDFSVHSKRCI